MGAPSPAHLPFDLMPDSIGIGIDLGMTFSGSAIYYYTLGGLKELDIIPHRAEQGITKFPSLVFYKQGKLVDPAIGSAAREQEMQRQPGHLYALVKRNLGTSWRDSQAGVEVTAQIFTKDVAMEVKRDIDAYLKAPARGWNVAKVKKRYAFSYPGKWGLDKIDDLNSALHAAGFSEYFVIEEPIATALGAAHYASDKTMFEPGNLVFVCDLGGGTLDFAIIEAASDGTISVKAAADGDPLLGMSNLDRIIGMLMCKTANLALTSKMQRILEQHLVNGQEVTDAWNEMPLDESFKSALLPIAELAKRDFCKNWHNTLQAAQLYTLPGNTQVIIKRTDVQPFIMKMNQLISEAADAELAKRPNGITRDRITHIVIGGGGGALPHIADGLKNIMPKAKLVDIPTDVGMSLVQRGTAIFAFQPDVVRERHSNYSFGLVVLNDTKPAWPNPRTSTVKWDGKDKVLYHTYKKLVQKDDVVQDFEYVCYPPGDNEELVVFTVIVGEDENPYSPNNTVVGTAELKLPKGATRSTKLTYTFKVNKDGHFTSSGRSETGQFTTSIKFNFLNKGAIS